MKVYLVLIDSRPAYFPQGRQSTSLLLAPFGTDTIVGQLAKDLGGHCVPDVTVVADFAPRAEYVEALKRACPAVDAVVPVAQFSRFLASHEPSDWLLMIDPRCTPATDYGVADLLAAAAEDPRWVRHLVALEDIESGAKEYVQLDPEGRVSRVQRYYDAITWSLTSGVACSLLPVSTALITQEIPFATLPDLRGALASRGVPCQDVPVTGGVFDLTEERGLLEYCQRSAMGLFARGGDRADRSASATLDETARIVGPVVVQDDVVVEADALVLGPSILGAGCRIGPGAVVAQCVVPRGAVVAAGSTLRHHVVLDDTAVETERPPDRPFAGVMTGLGGAAVLPDRPRERRVYPVLKLVAESAMAALVLLVLLPFLLLAAILVKLDSKGPALYGDKREGKGGRLFRCWKFRSMVKDADAQQRKLREASQVDGPQFKMEHDPRVTRVGRVFRRTNIDELPQLINVALGQMSFVGPRPSPFRENQTCIPWREGRLSVRPGITGLWQICRRDRSTGDFHQWIYYDLLYVRHMSLWVDLKILSATILTLGGRHTVPLTWIIPPRREEPGSAAPDLRSLTARV